VPRTLAAARREPLRGVAAHREELAAAVLEGPDDPNVSRHETARVLLGRQLAVQTRIPFARHDELGRTEGPELTENRDCAPGIESTAFQSYARFLGRRCISSRIALFARRARSIHARVQTWTCFESDRRIDQPSRVPRRRPLARHASSTLDGRQFARRGSARSTTDVEIAWRGVRQIVILPAVHVALVQHRQVRIGGESSRLSGELQTKWRDGPLRGPTIVGLFASDEDERCQGQNFESEKKARSQKRFPTCSSLLTIRLVGRVEGNRRTFAPEIRGNTRVCTS